MFTPGTFREVLNGRHVVYIGALDERELRHVFIQTREPDGDISITTGESGHQETGEDGIRHIVLDHGYRYRGVRPAGVITKSYASNVPRCGWIRRRLGKSGVTGKRLPPRSCGVRKNPITSPNSKCALIAQSRVLVIALWAPLAGRDPSRARAAMAGLWPAC
jgi:lipopolysaccharide export system permease protein